MIVYLATKTEFKSDILSNRIEEKILASFQGVLVQRFLNNCAFVTACAMT
jgi:hypothetical protein